MRMNFFSRMSTKSKIILIAVLAMIIIILGFFLWIYINYGAFGVQLTIVGIVFIFAFLFFIYLEAKYPRKKGLSPMERAERERAYQQERGRLEAQEDMRQEREWIRQERKRRKRVDDFFSRPPW